MKILATVKSLSVASLLTVSILFAPGVFAQTADDAFEAGKQSFSAQEYPKAIESLTTAIKQAPSFAKAYELRGSSYNALKQWDKGIADFTAALKIDPKMYLAILNRGLAYYATGKYQQAIDDLSKYLETYSEDERALEARGKAYDKIGKNDLARKDADAAGFAAAIRNARDRFRQQKYDEAIVLVNQAIQTNPTSPLGYALRGETYEKQKKFDLALADFKKQVELSPPDNPEPLYFLGKGYMQVKDYPKSIETLVKYNSMKKDDPQAWFLLGTVQQDAKNYPDAQKSLDKANELSPANYLYLFYSAKNHRLTGDNDKAIAEITESYKLAPNEEWVLVERAIAYEKLGKNDLAELDRKVMKDKGYPEWNLKE
ncbi:tetratricopeptide repeat protein [Candidatus Obscuribacterales bacterium]|nr:tetratricopeptide repeat protein [Candidatus Obscuribacterales bacterium]MBX3151013.1 tetratricopeptide repeat protein [Candidatus Obscuribacterales bacterium]